MITPITAQLIPNPIARKILWYYVHIYSNIESCTVTQKNHVIDQLSFHYMFTNLLMKILVVF